MDQIAKKLIFVGKVQGVGFRFTALNVANQYGLNGWVRNLHDGTVEMIAQGPPEDINDCIQSLQESYPGRIEKVKAEDIPLDPKLKDFKITF